VTHDPRSPADVQAEQQRQTAAWCGYTGGDAVDRLNDAHDPYHRLLSALLGRKFSPTLRWVETGALAHPCRARHEDAVGWEEDLVLETQRWMETGEYGSTLRALWWFGLDPETLRLQLLEAGRR